MALFAVILFGFSGSSLLKAELVPEFAPIRQAPARSGIARDGEGDLQPLDREPETVPGRKWSAL